MKNSTFLRDVLKFGVKTSFPKKTWLSLLCILSVFFANDIHAQAPGGVSTGLSLWVKSNQGVITTGTAVTGWNDQSTGGKNLSTTTATYQPSFVAATPMFNYNPAINFNGDFLRNTGNVLLKNSSASIFTILNQTVQSGYSTVWDFLANDPGLHTLGNQWTLYHGGNSTYHSLKSVLGQTTLMSAHWQHNLAATSFIEINGKSELASRAITTNGNNYYIGGGSVGAAEPWKGFIAENIVYDAPLIGVDLQKVNSYLAVKYGITLDNNPANNAINYDYLSSSSSVIWNGTINNLFHNNIFGIGRDDNSALMQLKSKSINSGSVMSIEIPSISTNETFLMVGDNGGMNNMSVNYTPNSFVSELPYFHLAKIWKVQETGTVGTITIELLGINATHLLVHSSSSFNTGTPQEIEIVNGKVSFDLTDGQYFTFAAPARGPGGVHTNLAVWLRADEGTSSTMTGSPVSSWSDQSGKGRTHTQTVATSQPLFNGEDGSYLMSYNPSLRFKGMGNGNANNKYFSINNYLATTEAVHLFSVSRINGVGNTAWQTVYSFTADITHPDWYLQAPSMRLGGIQKEHAPSKIKYAIASALMPKTGSQRHIWNGTTKTFTNTLYTIATGISPTFTLGVDRNNTDALTGDIQEVIVYAVPAGGDMPAAAIQQIQSYLAIKYGISLSASGQADYVAGDGTTKFWTGANNNGYQNNIFGIGRDATSSFHQKQAYSFSDSSIAIYIGNLAKLNILNGSNIEENNAYLVFGNNNLSGNTSVNYTVGTSFQNGTTTERVNIITNKIWKAQATTISTWNINVKTTLFSNAKYVLVSGDESFTPATTRMYPVVNGHAMNVEVNDGEFLRIASYNTAPGGVFDGLSLWLRADIGANGSILESWIDQSGYGRDLYQEEETYFPKVEPGNPIRNFNPAVRFDESSIFRDQDFVPNTSGTGISVFSVASIANNDGNYKTLWDFYTNNPALHTLSSNWVFFAMGGNHTNPVVVNKNTIANTHWIIGTNGSRVNEVDGLTTSITGNVVAPSANKYIVGAGNETSLENWIGDIFENIVYTNKIVGDDLIKVNTYLSLKYGATLKNPTTYQYQATDGTTIWDGAANAAYHNNIAGIGFDEVELLNQKQSRSVNAGNQITIGLGAIETNNAENANSFTNDVSYLVWGDNGITNSNTTLLQYSTTVAMNHLNRIWRMQNTNMPNKVMIRFPAALQPGALVGACEGYKMIVSNDATFTNASIINIEPVTIDGGDFVSTFTFPAGVSYFTLSRVDPSIEGAVYLPLEDMETQFYSDCSMNEWKYFYEGITQSQKLLGTSDFSNAELDNLTVNITTSGGSFNSSTRETNIMSRIVTITDATNGTYTGGKIRIYLDPEELALIQVSGALTNSWFKYSGNAVDAISDILDDGVFVSGSAVALTPDATGIEDGIDYVEFHNITSFSSFMYISSTEITGVVLPISLGKLNAVKESTTIKLNWNTITENNNNRFEIERALPNGQWVSIGTVQSLASNGNSATTINYSFVDNNPTIGLNTYRLKQVDFDGRFTYSTTVYVNYNSQAKISIQPNPVVTNTTITGLEAGDQVQLYNSFGQLVQSTIATSSILTMDVSHLSAGIHYVRVVRNGESHTLKMLKVK